MTSAKNIVRFIVCAVLCGAWPVSANAQLNFDYTKGKFLIKGQVIDAQAHTVIAMANIKILNSGRGITCDEEGFFTMYVSKNDTLEFSSVGYLTKKFRVAQFDSTRYYTLAIELLHDFIKLREVTIYPYRDLDEFKKAFVDAKDQNKVNIPGLAPPKYSHVEPKPKFSNPISYLYDRLKHRSSADPDFKP